MKRICIYILIISMLLVSCGYEQTYNAEYTQHDLLLDSSYHAGISLPIFDKNSLINTKIGTNAVIHENSAAMIERLVNTNENGSNVVLSVDQWSIPVYYADNNTPRLDVALTNNWGLEYEYLINVPIPDNAIADPSHDGHMCIIDIDAQFVYEFWQFGWDDDTPYATWGSRISLDSNGIYPYGMSARGSGFSLIAGVIFPDELASGSIDHALAISMPIAKSGGPVYPATESDGISRKSGAIPEGARLQLNPDLDLDSLALNRYEYIICKALQEYGAFVVDMSGSIEFEIINPISFSEDIYADYFTDEWTILDNMPLEELRVLDYDEQINKPDIYVADESIYR